MALTLLLKVLKGSKKAQIMSMLVLLMFLLMLAELFTFAMLNVSGSNIAESLSLSQGAGGYANLLNLSAKTFAKASATRALQVLTQYELNPALRKDNFITNLSLYMSDLMINGTLPNETTSYTQNAMGNLTLANYNISIANTLAFYAQNITINETKPMVYQTSPYALQVAYTENVRFTTSSTTYHYSINANATIPLNNTLDLFYAQQGVARPIHFASLANITSIIGNAHATTGNYLGVAYGTIYALPSNAISGASCPSSSPITGMPTQDIILATYNAINLGSCTGYAGLITYIAPSSTPAFPYLVYSSSTNILQYLPTGSKVLLYGPGLDVLNVENLRNAVGNGYYFASPYTPSYISRASADFAEQSPNGIFTFSNAHRQVAQFNGQSSYITASVNNIPTGSEPRTVTAWFYVPTEPPSGNQDSVFAYGTANNCDQTFWVSVTGTGATCDGGQIFVDNWCTCQAFPGLTTLKTNTWYFVAFEYNGTYQIGYLGVSGGQLVKVDEAVTINTGTSPFYIGYWTVRQYFNGNIANVQIYNTALSASQIQALYQEGISGLPISNAGLVGWWPLNGNANDYSGNGNNGVATSVSYAQPSNYTRDSIKITPSYVTSPLPGILSCTSNTNCANPLPKLFLSSSPLENGQEYAAQFNGQNGYIAVDAALPLSPSQLTVCAWINPTVITGSRREIVGNDYTSSDSFFLSLNNNGNSEGDFWVHTTSGWQGPVVTPSAVPLNTWSFLCANWTGSNEYIYLNGKSVGSLGTSGTISLPMGVPIEIGADDENMQWWDGSISNIQIYNASLSASQIQQLYKEGIGGAPIDLQHLVGWWQLNGNANDYSGNGNNGTQYNVWYSPINGTYSAPGLSSIIGVEDEWESIGMTN